MTNSGEVYRRFGRLLARSRERAGLTQEKLAASLGLSRTSVTNIERGRQPIQLHTLYAISDTLGAELVDLLPAVPRSEADLSIDPRALNDLNIKQEQFVRKIAKSAKSKGR